MQSVMLNAKLTRKYGNISEWAEILKIAAASLIMALSVRLARDVIADIFRERLSHSPFAAE